jgi:hypothetical protein
MKNKDKGEIIPKGVYAFVESIKGTYEQYVSEDFLQSLLAVKILENMTVYKATLPDAARLAGEFVFGFIMNKFCKMPENGMLMAQKLEQMFNTTKHDTRSN